MMQPEGKITRDDFLGGRIQLHQPEVGYRISTDTVFLAASLNLKKGERMLDMGAGTGGILSCFAARMQEKLSENSLHGIEIQDELICHARTNATHNGFGSFISYFQGDIADPPEECEPNSYHHVVSNPPYLEKGTATRSPFESKARAHMDHHIALKDWVGYCLRMLRPRGILSLVHRTDRMDDIITALAGKAGDIMIYPLWPDHEKASKRVIIRARKGAKGPLCLKKGLVVHTSDGSFTDRAEAVLRHGAPIEL